ncbi:MAG: nucleoside monophosphate kinase [Clostridiales bacterium]|nr:nucleoside monophosphate kinase [Candidatus Apopatousia equi]
MNIVLIGAPLSGKGTQAEQLCNKFNLVHISTGDLLREIMNQPTPLGKQVKSYMDKATLVPDDLTIEVIKEELSKVKNSQGILFDGFPRTLTQAKKLKEIIDIDLAVYIKADLQDLLDRINVRFICSDCKKTNTVYSTVIPKCKFCGGELTKRKDDTKEIVEYRFDEFKKITYPIVDYYEKENKLFTVNGKLSIEEVYKIIEDRLKKI